MTDTESTEAWQDDRTTFQRIYDLLVGTQTFRSASEFATQAHCSETGARRALEQLSEMRIAVRQEGRPTTYRRNDSYIQWKRIDALTQEHDDEELQDRIQNLILRDEDFQEKYDVPDPNAVSTTDLPVDAHDRLHERWDDLNEWRSIRRDIRLLRRAVDQSKSHVSGGVEE
jgi:hypothetical protein